MRASGKVGASHVISEGFPSSTLDIHCDSGVMFLQVLPRTTSPLRLARNICIPSTFGNRLRANRLPPPFPRSSCGRWRPVSMHAPTNTQEADVDVDEIPDFGSYSIILPSEPYVFGTNHIQTRNVPSRISRPPYAHPKQGHEASSPNGPDGIEAEPDNGNRIQRLRNAARLAREVLGYAGGLVRVSSTSHLHHFRG
jgi:hypothetical protein